jgi:hypothetical protein
MIAYAERRLAALGQEREVNPVIVQERVQMPSQATETKSAHPAKDSNSKGRGGPSVEQPVPPPLEEHRVNPGLKQALAGAAVRREHDDFVSERTGPGQSFND